MTHPENAVYDYLRDTTDLPVDDLKDIASDIVDIVKIAMEEEYEAKKERKR